jgi:hypothetical protein
MPALSSADALATLRAWLQAHPRVLEEFGGPDHVSGQNRAPYPHLMVKYEPGGSDRDLRWLLKPEVSLTAVGDPDGTLGSEALRALLFVALGAAVELGETAAAAGQAVVSYVESSSASRPTTIPLTGQAGWAATVIVSVHPPV